MTCWIRVRRQDSSQASATLPDPSQTQRLSSSPGTLPAGPRVWLGTRPGPEQGVVSGRFGQNSVIFDVVHSGLTPRYLFAIKELVPN